MVILKELWDEEEKINLEKLSLISNLTWLPIQLKISLEMLIQKFKTKTSLLPYLMMVKPDASSWVELVEEEVETPLEVSLGYLHSTLFWEPS